MIDNEQIIDCVNKALNKLYDKDYHEDEVMALLFLKSVWQLIRSCAIISHV